MHNIYTTFHLGTGEQIFQLHIPFYNMLHICSINTSFPFTWENCYYHSALSHDCFSELIYFTLALPQFQWPVFLH